jgi:hypothetical protein
MTLKQFFRNGILDNNFQGHSLSDLDFTEDFNLNTGGTWRERREGYRKDGLVKFITTLDQYLGNRLLSELPIKKHQFGEDVFEANLAQPFFSVSGHTVDDILIYTGNIVGSIRWDNQEFTINCRFGNWFLQYMIASACGFIELEKLGAIDYDLGLAEWVLLYYFKLQLKKALAKGLYKTYSTKRENLSTIRGTIHMNSYLKKRYFDGRTVCEFKSHSYQNDINAVISMALNRVFSSKYCSLVADIYPIKTVFDDLNISKGDRRTLNVHKITNPYFNHYLHVAQLSKKILDDEFASVGPSSSPVSAFLFDISLLFEQHIRQVLQRVVQIIPKKEQGRVPNGLYENYLIPDILIQYFDNKISVYDVKYKHFNCAKGVDRDDQFQLVTYVAACLAKYDVVECGIIYPLRAFEFDKTENLKENQILQVSNKKIPFKIRFYKIFEGSQAQFGSDMEFSAQFKNFTCSE